ncbi:MAG: DUF2283 domain-containing protein [Rhodospirillales bacterium]|nr:DUF2283 domain-containing protein [Rhodospirillales bacterium]
MKIEVDPIADALYVELADSEVQRSEEISRGVILDYNQNDVVGVEVLSVSKRGAMNSS